jgi:hypothetical protein
MATKLATLTWSGYSQYVIAYNVPPALDGGDLTNWISPDTAPSGSEVDGSIEYLVFTATTQVQDGGDPAEYFNDAARWFVNGVQSSATPLTPTAGRGSPAVGSTGHVTMQPNGSPWTWAAVMALISPGTRVNYGGEQDGVVNSTYSITAMTAEVWGTPAFVISTDELS